MQNKKDPDHQDNERLTKQANYGTIEQGAPYSKKESYLEYKGILHNEMYYT